MHVDDIIFSFGPGHTQPRQKCLRLFVDLAFIYAELMRTNFGLVSLSLSSLTSADEASPLVYLYRGFIYFTPS